MYFRDFFLCINIRFLEFFILKNEWLVKGFIRYWWYMIICGLCWVVIFGICIFWFFILNMLLFNVRWLWVSFVIVLYFIIMCLICGLFIWGIIFLFEKCGGFFFVNFVKIDYLFICGIWYKFIMRSIYF